MYAVVAFAQSGDDAAPTEAEEIPRIDLGERKPDRVYPIRLTAQNFDCEGEHSFRFLLEEIAWLRSESEALVEDLSPGERGSIDAVLDFSDMPPGEIAARLEIECETCGFWIFKSCHASHQEMLLTASVVPAAPSAAASEAATADVAESADASAAESEATAADADEVAEAAESEAATPQQTTQPAESAARRKRAGEPNNVGETGSRIAADEPVDLATLRSRTIARLASATASLVASRSDAPWGADFSDERDCPRLRRAIAALRAEIAESGCEAEKRALDAALAALERVRGEVEEERARRQAARARARALGAAYQDALAAAEAARAELERAQAAFDAARQAIADAFHEHYGWPPDRRPFMTDPPDGAGDDYKTVPLAEGIEIGFEDKTNLIYGPHRQRLIDRMRRDIRYDLENGRALLAEAEAAKAALDAAKQALADAEAALEKAAAAFRDADSKAHHLPPLEAPLRAAEQRVEDARAAYEACMERLAALKARLAQLLAKLERCERLEALERRIERAAEDVAEAEAAAEEAGQDVSGLEGLEAADAGEPERSAADTAAAEAADAAEEARAALKEARAAVEDGDPKAAQGALGRAAKAASAAHSEADTARQQASAARRAKAIARAKQPKPVTPHPATMSKRQILFHANTLLAKLNRDAMLEGKRRCDCERLALIAAQRANEAVAGELFGMLIDVMAAPFQFSHVLKGLGMTSRLAPLKVGIGTALLKSVAAGRNFSEETAKAVVDFLGGEVFKELLDSDFVASRMNALAQGGLERLSAETGKVLGSFSKEDVAIDCRDGSGESRVVDVHISFVGDPDTGWVGMFIRVGDCPPVIVKYRVADGAVPLVNAQRGYGGPQVMVAGTR